MTFERHYKNILKLQLESVTNRRVYVSNDLHYQPLENDPDGVVLVINTGGTSRSSIAGFDMNTIPLSINFICQANYLQEIFGILNEIARENNARYYETEIDGMTFYYQVIYSDATQIGGAYKAHVKGGTHNFVTGNWILNITYSENAIIEPSTFKLKIGSTEYDVKFINRYDMSAIPVTEPIHYIGEEGPYEELLDTKIAYSFVLLKVKSDSLQTKLRQHLTKATNLNKEALQLKIDGETIDINNLSVTEIYENKTAVYNLVLNA